MIGDKSSALSSEIRIFFRNPVDQSPKDSDHMSSGHKRQTGKQGSHAAPQKIQVSPQKPLAYQNVESSKDQETFGDEDQQIDQFQDYAQIQSEYEQLRRWFEGLSVAERVNCLTTTYPSFVSRLIEAHFEMRDNGVLSLFKRHTSASASNIYQMQSQSAYSQSLGFGLGINIAAQSQYKQQMQQMYSRYDSKIQQHTSYGQKATHLSKQNISQAGTIEFPIFELVKSEDIQMRNLGSQSARQLQEEFLKQIRITDYKQQFDTLTVGPQLVQDPSKFFSLIAEISGHKAFREPVLFKQKGGRVKIDSPAWSKKMEYTYLCVWIIVTLEESLWAHYNFANRVNIDRNVRQDALNNMFKERQDSLQSQEELAKRWQDIGNLGRKRLIEKLKAKAKESFQVFESVESHHLAEDVHVISEEYNCTALNMQGFNGYQTEDLVNAFTPSNHAIKSAYASQSPYSQFYTFHKIPLRSTFNRGYSELFLTDPESHFARSLTHDRDLHEILDFVQTDWAHITPLDVIKFLSETPIEEMDSAHRARKTFLCRELNSLIQEDLRQSIQNQLLNEDAFGSRGKQTTLNSQTNSNSMHLNSAAASGSVKKQKPSHQGGKQNNKEPKDSTADSETSLRNAGTSPAPKTGQKKKKTKNKVKQQSQAEIKNDDQGDEKSSDQEQLQKKISSEVPQVQQQMIDCEPSEQTVKEIRIVEQSDNPNERAKRPEDHQKDDSTKIKSQGMRKKRKGKGNNMHTNQQASQPVEVIKIETVQIEKIDKGSKKVSGSKDGSEQRKDWLQRQTNSALKRKTSQQSRTFSQQICEATGSSTHSFDDEKFCSGTGPSSGGGLFSDDNTNNEGDSKKAAKKAQKTQEILLLDCEEENCNKSSKTANFLTKINTRQPNKTEKQAKQQNKLPSKRADSSEQKADWNTVGSGLMLIHKGISRESEPEPMKQALDFQQIFEEEVKTAAKTSTEGNSKMTRSTVSDKTQNAQTEKTNSNKLNASHESKQIDHKLGLYSFASKDQKEAFTKVSSSSLDLISSKPSAKNEEKQSKTHKDQSKEGHKRKNSGRKKRVGSRSSSNAREETVLIRHFVTQLIDRACSIVMREQKDSSDETSSQNFADAHEETKANVEQKPQPDAPIQLQGNEVDKQQSGNRTVDKKKEESQNNGPKDQNRNVPISNEQTMHQNVKAEKQNFETWRQPTKVKEQVQEAVSASEADVKKKRRNRNKKKNDNEIALNNFMRQVAGETNTSAKTTGGKSAKADKPKSKQAPRNDKNVDRKEEGERPGRRRRGSQRSNQSKKHHGETAASDFTSPVDDDTTIAESTPMSDDFVVNRASSLQEVTREIIEEHSQTVPVEQKIHLIDEQVNEKSNEQTQKLETSQSDLVQQPDSVSEHWNFGFKPHSMDFNEADDRKKPYGRFDQSKGKLVGQRFQKPNPNGQTSAWTDRKRDAPYETDINQDNRKQFGGGLHWNQGSSFGQNRTYHGQQHQTRQHYFQGHQRYGFEYNKDKYAGQSFDEGIEFQNMEGREQLPQSFSQRSYGPYPETNLEQWSRPTYSASSKQAESYVDVQPQISDFKPNFKPFDKNNPFLQRSSRASFTPQTNIQIRTSSMEQELAQNECFDVDKSRGAQRSVERKHKESFSAEGQEDTSLIKQLSAECSKSVWSQQSNPFRPSEQNWPVTGPSSPFNPSRSLIQLTDSQFNSPVQPQSNYIKVIGSGTLTSFNPTDQQIHSSGIYKQSSFQQRVPSFDTDQTHQGDTLNRVLSKLQNYAQQEQPFEQFGFANNRRVSNYQVQYQNAAIIMQFLEGIGDPMSMFNDADNEQKILQADPMYRSIEDQFYSDFDVSISQYIGQITASVAQYKHEREVVLQKIQAIANKVYTNQTPNILMFGSLMTGLALGTSDMDLVVQGLNISDRQVMIDEMHSLAEGLSQWDLVEDLKPIDTASIPVIKANINLKLLRAREKGETDDSPANEEDMLPIDITFDDTPASSQATFMSPIVQSPPQSQDFNFQFGMNQFGSPFGAQNMATVNFGFEGFGQNFGFGYQNQNFASDQLIPEEQSFVPPSYQQKQKTHLGLASCRLIKDYVSTYPHLKEVGILLKTFLQAHDLNKAYLGGISSYSAVLLIVAYMNHFNLQHNPHITTSRLLMGFLDFYANCFDAQRYGVKTMNQMSYYPLTQMNQPMFVIVDPVNPSNNTARNSFRTPDVLKSFRDAFKRLKSLIYGRFQSLRTSALVTHRAPGIEAANAASEGKDLLQFAAIKKDVEEQRLQAKDTLVDYSKVFGSVDFVQTFLKSEQADEQ